MIYNNSRWHHHFHHGTKERRNKLGHDSILIFYGRSCKWRQTENIGPHRNDDKTDSDRGSDGIHYKEEVRCSVSDSPNSILLPRHVRRTWGVSVFGGHLPVLWRYAPSIVLRCPRCPRVRQVGEELMLKCEIMSATRLLDNPGGLLRFCLTRFRFGMAVSRGRSSGSRGRLELSSLN